MASSNVPRIPWAQFSPVFRKRWEQGEHVFINGETGSGKTDLMLRLMRMRGYGVFFVSKPRDPILRDPLAREYAIQNSFNPSHVTPKIMLKATRGDSTRDEIGNQAETFAPALDRIYREGRWTAGFDETLWISNRLKLADEISDIAYLGRALKLTGLYATQRPKNFPILITQNATHAFISKVGHPEDLKTLAYLGSDSDSLRNGIRALRNKHDFLYLDRSGVLPMVIVNTHE